MLSEYKFRRGFAQILAFLIGVGVLVLVVIGGIEYHRSTGIPFIQSGNFQLQDSEIADLISYLKANNLQAAIVQKIYPPNGESNWIVKSDGQKILLDNEDLGVNGWGQPNYLEASKGLPPFGIKILEDQAEVGGLNYYKYYGGPGPAAWAKIRDISMYIGNHSVDQFWHANPIPEGNFWSWQGSVGGNLSPDGKYMIDFQYAPVQTSVPQSQEHEWQFLLLNKVIKQSSALSYQPISLIPGMEYLWSPDSKHLLLRNRQGPPLGVYDVASATTSYLVDKTGHMQIKSANGTATGTLISDANGSHAVTFPWITLRATSTSDGFLENLPSLPKQIRLVGFIQ